MNNSDQDKQDQRRNSGMEDSTAMTIEFLRARLLSERSVSKTARQRADELAKRVAELEEQLRIVSLQRMKAEKATADVLAILESNGLSDTSETFDSNSDQDTPCEYKVGNEASKEDEVSVNSKVRKCESEEISGSELDFSPADGRSLSWKGRKNSTRSLEKCKDPSLRRQSSFVSTSSSQKHLQGKSCRKIRCKESRYTVDESKANSIKIDSPENGIVNTSEVFLNCSNVEPEALGERVDIGGDKAFLDGPLSGSLENGLSARGNELDDNTYGSNREMEKALEHQAELIGRYAAMEKAQREWEEKFRENNGSTPDSCDQGNRSDITEEGYETKAQVPHPAVSITSQTHMAKPEVEETSIIQPNGMQLRSDVNLGCLKEWKSNGTPTPGSPPQDFAFHAEKGKQNLESVRNNYHPSSHGFGNNYHPSSHDSQNHSDLQNLHDSPGNKCEASFPSNADGRFSKEIAFGRFKELYAMVPHKASNELGGVLEALEQARQSLQQKIKTLPLVEGGSVGKSVVPSLPAAIPGDKANIPIGCVGLFRLPTDFLVEGNTQANFLGSSVRSSFGNYYSGDLDAGVPAAAGNSFVSRSYSANGSSFPAEDQFPTSRYVDGRSRIYSQRPPFDPNMDTSLPPSGRYNYSSYPMNPSYPNTMPLIPHREGFPSFRPSRSVGLPPARSNSFSDDHIRPNMYR